MKPVAYLFVCFALGCTASVDAPPVPLVSGGVVAAVSSDQAYLAYFNGIPLVANPATLSVRDLASGASTPLGGPNSFGIGFGTTGHTLLFHPNAMPDTSLGSNAPGVLYGGLSIWSPSLVAPISASKGFDTMMARTADSSVVLFFDNPAPSDVGVGAVRLVRASDCSGATCPPLTLADNIQIGRMVVSSDGRFDAYERIDDDGTHEFWLGSVAGGTSSKVASTLVSNAVSGITKQLLDFSPDGSMLATVATVNGSPMQLQIVSTATGSPIAWGALPAGTSCTDITFSDSTTLFTIVLDGQGSRSLYRSTSVGAAPFLDVDNFTISHARAGDERFIWFTTQNTPGGLTQTHLVDLAAAVPTPVQIADGSPASPQFSDDLTAAWIFDDFDLVSFTATLKSISLPSGSVTTVALGVSSGGASFARGTSKLLFLAATNPSQSSSTGLSLFEWSGGDPILIEESALSYAAADNPPTLYVSLSEPLGIFSRPLP